MSCVRVLQDMQRMSSGGEEMELFSIVTKKFKQVFARQEHMKTFRTYDFTEVQIWSCVS